MIDVIDQVFAFSIFYPVFKLILREYYRPRLLIVLSLLKPRIKLDVIAF
jgi:hypothetical protein